MEKLPDGWFCGFMFGAVSGIVVSGAVLLFGGIILKALQ